MVKDLHRYHLLVLVLVPVMWSQALQLQELQDHHGVLPSRRGNAIVSSDKWTVAKRLVLRPIIESLKDKFYNCTQLDKLVNK